MINLIFHWTIGLLVSYIVAMPMGPVNVAIVQTTINRGRREAYRIAIGSAIIELFYCLIAVAGVQLVFGTVARRDEILFNLKLISIPLLLGLGIYNLIRKREKEEDEKNTTRYHGFWLGFFLNLINPSLLPVWLAVSAYLLTQNWIENDFNMLLFYAIGAGVGTFLLHLTIVSLTSRFQPKMTPRRKEIIDRIVGGFFVIFGVYVCVSVALSFFGG